MSTTQSKEPAIKSYFFGKGYRDLAATIRDSWVRNMLSAKDFFERAPGASDGAKVFESGMWGAAGISTLVFGTVFFAVASVFHALVLGLFFLTVYLGYSVLWLVERSYLWARSFFMACPHCHESSLLPEYLCDGCGAVHAKLLPNSYGITSHICTCGRKLPSTFFSNRGRLQARCPVCRQSIAREHVESRRIFIPIMGGPSAGKSAFLFGAVRELMEHEAARMGLVPGLFDKRSEAAYRSATALLESGRSPDKTADPIPRAFNLSFHKGGELAFLLYLYDPAGEAYAEADKLSAHGFHSYLSGMIFVVDPFGIERIRTRYADEIGRAAGALKPSDLPIEDAIDRLLLSLEADFGLAKTGRLKEPLAIVINKVDAFDLEETVGERAVDAAMKSGVAEPPLSRDAVRDLLIRDWLMEWGEEAFVSRVEARFKTVRYFTCSALGRMPDGAAVAFTPSRVLTPIQWIISMADKKTFRGPW